MWLTWLAPWTDLIDRSGTPLGGDFVMFYNAGRVFQEGHLGALYDDAVNQAKVVELIPHLDPHETWPYRYPPVVARCFSILARIPFGMSFLLYAVVSAALAIFAIRKIWEISIWSRPSAVGVQSPMETRYRHTLLCLFIGWPILLETLMGGQLSTVALAIICTSFWLIKGRDFFKAGLILSLAVYKPNVLFFVIIGMLIRYPRIACGLVVGACAIVGISMIELGVDPWLEFCELGSCLATTSWALETPSWKVHGLVPWLQPVLGEFARPILLGGGIACSIALGCVWRLHGIHEGRVIAVLVLVNALANPYVPIYDLLLLGVVPIAWFGIPQLCENGRVNAESSRVRPGHGRLVRWREAGLGLLFFGPHLSQAIAKNVGWQLFPLIVLALSCVLGWRIWREAWQLTYAKSCRNARPWPA